MNKINNQLIFSLILLCMFSLVVIMPVEVLGCYTRGLTAVLIALLGALIGLFTAVKGLTKKITGKSDSTFFIVNSIIFATPAIYILLIAS